MGVHLLELNVLLTTTGKHAGKINFNIDIYFAWNYLCGATR